MNLSPDAASGLPQTHENARTSHFRLAGVRKHARKTHLAWLKSVDESAGNRDRHLESKPSTYCFKEEGPFQDDGMCHDIDEEPSPLLMPAQLSPSLGAAMNNMSMAGHMPELPMLSLPDAAQMQGNVHGGHYQPSAEAARQAARDMSNAMAAAAAASLLGQGPPPPLAWLLAQSAAAAASCNAGQLNPAALAAACAAAGVPFPLPPMDDATMAAHLQMVQQQMNGMPNNGMGHTSAPMAPWMAPGPQNALPPRVSMPMPPMPPPMPPMAPPMAAPTKLPVKISNTNPSSPISLGFEDLPNASEDLSTLFGVATGDEDEPAAASRGQIPGEFLAEDPVEAAPQKRYGQAIAQPLCLTPPSSSVLTSGGSQCVSPFELDKRPRAVDENSTEMFNKKQPEEAQAPTDEPLSSKLESEYHAFADSLLA